MRVWLQLLVPPGLHWTGRGSFPLPDPGDLRGVGLRQMFHPEGGSSCQVQAIAKTFLGLPRGRRSQHSKVLFLNLKIGNREAGSMFPRNILFYFGILQPVAKKTIDRYRQTFRKGAF